MFEPENERSVYRGVLHFRRCLWTMLMSPFPEIHKLEAQHLKSRPSLWPCTKHATTQFNQAR